jgi:hypothetical protein
LLGERGTDFHLSQWRKRHSTDQPVAFERLVHSRANSDGADALEILLDPHHGRSVVDFPIELFRERLGQLVVAAVDFEPRGLS